MDGRVYLLHWAALNGSSDVTSVIERLEGVSSLGLMILGRAVREVASYRLRVWFEVKQL